jgi:hypothetical protein
MASMLGRAMVSSEHVHHIDGNRENDSPENLELLTADEHNKHHKNGTRHTKESRSKISLSLIRAHQTGIHAKPEIKNRGNDGRISKTNSSLSIEDRFFSKVWKDPNGCWVWDGAKVNGIYGNFRVDGKSLLAHRFAYTQFVGELPIGTVITHSCQEPSCVNPEHLLLITNQEAIERRRSQITGRMT